MKFRKYRKVDISYIMKEVICMKRRILTGFVLCALTVSCLLLASGCGGDAEEAAPVINPIEITVSIDFPKKAELEDVSDEPFKIEENSTVLEAIQLYCNVADMPITVETTDGSVQGIGGVENGDYYSSRIWQYKLNGELCTVAEAQQKLQDGDVLEWVYKSVKSEKDE